MQNPTHILLLSSQYTSARMDISTLRNMGVRQISHCKHSTDAITLIKNNNNEQHWHKRIDLLICHEFVGQQETCVFLLDLTKQGMLLDVPVLLLSSSQQSTSRLTKTGTVVLERPFTQNTLAQSALHATKLKNLYLTAQPRTAHKHTPARKDAPLATTSEILERGNRFLQGNQIVEAQKCFEQLLQRRCDSYKLHLALANLYKKTSQPIQVQKHTLLAAAALLRNGQEEQALFIASNLPEHIRQGNFFAYEALFYLDNKEYRQAAHSFLEAANFEIHKPLHEIIARTCQFTDNPEVNISQICMAIEKMGKKTLASTLRHRLFAPPPAPYTQNPTWLDKYPVLKDALAIAGQTASLAWKNA